MSTDLAHASDVEPPHDDIPPAVIDAAIAWAIKLEFNQPSSATRQAFEEWRQVHALHALAWQRVQSLRQDFQAVPDGLVRNALQMVEARREAAHVGRRQALRLLMLTGVAVTGGWILRDSLGWQHLIADVATRVGEQRTLRLDDGTVVVLNTDSAVSFALEAARRRVVLRRGEIMITTGPDRDFAGPRPFWVDTPFGAMQALGTRFVVRLEGDRARVGVQDGAVRMYPVRGGAAATARVGELVADRRRGHGGRAIGFASGCLDRWCDCRPEHAAGRPPGRVVALPQRAHRLGRGGGRSACVRHLPCARYRPSAAFSGADPADPCQVLHTVLGGGGTRSCAVIPHGTGWEQYFRKSEGILIFDRPRDR